MLKICKISHEKTWMWLRKGNLMRKTEPLMIAVKINALKTNHIKARIHKLATLVEGDQKAAYSIATTPRCRGGRYSFP